MAIIDREHCVCLWYFSFSFFAWAVDVAHVTGLVSGFECWQIQMGAVYFVFVCICGFLFLGTWTVDVAHVSGFQRWQIRRVVAGNRRKLRGSVEF